MLFSKWCVDQGVNIMKRWIKLTVLTILLAILGIAGTASFSRAHAASEQYWTQRMNKVAPGRASARYPSINWNARDLGGYYAGHHHWTRRDVVFRGGNVGHISNYGIKRLKQLHIHEVIDLRSHNFAGGKDPQEGSSHNRLGVTYHRYSVNTAQQKRALYAPKHRYGEIYKYGAAFTTYRTARQAYRNVFDQLLKNQRGAVYFHCIQGRDRTGIMSALYLSALGVSRYHIYNDFLMSDYYKHKYSYRDQADELGHFYNTVNYYYGNMNGYLHRGLGLSDHQIHQLRQKYLVK